MKQAALGKGINNAQKYSGVLLGSSISPNHDIILRALIMAGYVIINGSCL